VTSPSTPANARPRIVVLDGYTLNPGDLSWDPLRALGECEIYERTSAQELLPRAQGGELIITNKAPLGREDLLQLPRLSYIGVTATGYNIVDVTTAKERGICVTNVPAYGTRSVAQHTMALLLELTQHVGRHSESVRGSGWVHAKDWCYWETPLVELDGLTCGIVGYGRIGQAVARLAGALGMRVLVAASARARQANELPRTVAVAELDQLFAESDVISLHCPLTPDTRHMVNAVRLARMKPSAFLLNTSRGALIDEAALAEALNRGQIAGAAVDVLSTEPPRADNPLLTARHCVLTPHLAWATRAARERLMRVAVENVSAYLEDKPQNVVS
jgi:glycerate dehydrogenase